MSRPTANDHLAFNATLRQSIVEILFGVAIGFVLAHIGVAAIDWLAGIWPW